jgi:uncharacterized protein
MKNEVLTAVQAGDAAKLKTLLERDPAAAAARDDNGVSALLHSVYRNRADIRDLLLGAHPALDVFEAAALGRTDRLAQLLEQDRTLVKSFSGDGFTPLHLAAFFQQEGTARLLLEKGADTAAVARNSMKVTPLNSAAAGRSLGVVRVLLDHGVDPNARQEQGWAAIHSAAQNGDVPMLELLLQRGANPRLANDQGATALSLAQEKGHTEIVRRLSAL